MLLHPMSQTDVLIVDVFLCLPTFQILCLLVLPNYKTHRPPGAEQSSKILLLSSRLIPPTTHMLYVCVCVCLFLCPSYLCFTFYFSLLTMKTMLFDLTAALNKPL